MADLRITREFEISATDLWHFMSSTDGLLQWWGPEGMTVPEHAMDFTKPGPWYSVMMGADGQIHKVSGQVTRVEPGKLVDLTWGWHDENDKRRPETHVRFMIEALGDARARLILDHMGLPDDDAAQNHHKGWTSSLRKLEHRLAKAAAP